MGKDSATLIEGRILAERQDRLIVYPVLLSVYNDNRRSAIISDRFRRRVSGLGFLGRLLAFLIGFAAPLLRLSDD
jgi:hypothetical protein